MTRTEKINNIFYPGIDTQYDELNMSSSFRMEITNAADGTIIQNEVPSAEFEEVIMTFDSHSGLIPEDTNLGRKTFSITNSDLLQGDIIKINSDYYSIKKIQGQTITINGILKNSIAADTMVETVGNTGIYKIPVQISTPGFYFCTIFHKKFGHAAIKYKITSTNSSDIMQELQLIKDKLNEKNLGFI